MSSLVFRFSCLATSVLLALALIPSPPSPAPASGSLAAAQDEATSAPAKQQERLMKLAGRYSTITKFTGPDGKPASGSTGEATFSSILGGRFLLQEEKGTMMGQPFEARKMHGFNTASKKYEGLWVYTGSTAMMNMTGSSADDGKTITYAASYEGPGGTAAKLEIVFTETGPDTFTIVLQSKAADGGKGAVMETAYTRKK